MRSVALLLLGAPAVVADTHAFHGCLTPEALALPYCDHSLPHEKRVANLLSVLTLDEKISLLSPTAKPFCAIRTPAISHVGEPGYRWLVEVNSCINAPCVAPDRCPTTFVGPEGIGASFNRTSWYLKGEVISTDLRVFNALGVSDGREGQLGLSGFGPNINLVKDPRYGRNSELPGEDPFLSGTYGVHYTQGMQQTSGGYKKINAYLKHYTTYNVESSRFTFKNNVTTFEFWDSYLPQYEMAMTVGNSTGVMCSYFAPNGVSACGDPWLLRTVLREQWNRPDAVVESDCSAVANMQKNGYANSPEDASAKALNAGMDLYGGWNDDLWGQGHLAKAITMNMTTAARVDESLRRALLNKMAVGLYDPLEIQPEWVNLTQDALNTTTSQAIAFDAALQSLVLLKNTDKTLPFKSGTSVAVVGPMATATNTLVSDYENAQFCYKGSTNCLDSIASAIARANAGGKTAVEQGIDVSSTDDKGVAAALSAVKDASATVLVLGITKSQEHEGIDRKDTLLPGLQYQFAQQVYSAAAGKPVVVLLVNGGIVSVDSIVDGASAMIETFNPVQQGPRAIAESIFGLHNRWGKLPVTIYPGNYTKELDMKSMSYTVSPGVPEGRSYRYYTGNATFTFGHGLSYTTFDLKCEKSAAAGNPSTFKFGCTVTNTGDVAGDEVVQVYHAVSADIRSAVSHPVPFRQLREFARLGPIAPKASTTTSFTLDAKSLAVTSADGDYVLYAGEHNLIFSRGHGVEVTIPVTVADQQTWTNAKLPKP